MFHENYTKSLRVAQAQLTTECYHTPCQDRDTAFLQGECYYPVDNLFIQAVQGHTV